MNHMRTPLVYSSKLSRRIKCDVYLKLEIFQGSTSFIDRGMFPVCEKYKEKKVKEIVTPNIGISGLSTAYCARNLGLKTHVIFPEDTSKVLIKRVTDEEATYEIHGKDHEEADRFARKICKNENKQYLCPLNDPVLWKGYSSIIDELEQEGPKPDAIICALGNGELLCGLYEGLKRNKWEDIDIITVEYSDNDKITLRVVHESLKLKDKHGRTATFNISEDDCAKSILGFADDHKMLTEVSSLYAISLFYIEEMKYIFSLYDNVCAIVCGGTSSNVSLLGTWRENSSL